VFSQGATLEHAHGASDRPAQRRGKAFALTERCGGIEQLKRLVDRLS
jgi:hypothetical protein